MHKALRHGHVCLHIFALIGTFPTLGGRAESSHSCLSQLYVRGRACSTAGGKNSFCNEIFILGSVGKATTHPDRVLLAGVLDRFEQKRAHVCGVWKNQVIVQPPTQSQSEFRLDKINSLVKKGQPLKQWSCRGMGEVKARLEVHSFSQTRCSL